MIKDAKAASYGVTRQPGTYRGMLNGIDKLANAIRRRPWDRFRGWSP